jgi:hypothetical protein
MKPDQYISIFMSYFQNIMTISSAFLLFIPTFMEKLVKKDKVEFFAHLSTGAFIFAIGGSLWAQIGLSQMASGYFGEIVDRQESGRIIANTGQNIAWWAFGAGILFLSLYILINLLGKKKKEESK